jgi:Raf kinase inhibitor-like YbhB/YbcL family protein
MKITSTAFNEGEMIPSVYTADGNDVNPPLEISDIPEATQTMVLIVDDPDAPAGTWLHWLVFNIPKNKTVIEENSVPGTLGINDFKKVQWGGPSPPHGKHRYFFKIFALDNKIDMGEGVFLNDIEKAMKDHILDQAELMGVYER